MLDEEVPDQLAASALDVKRNQTDRAGEASRIQSRPAPGVLDVLPLYVQEQGAVIGVSDERLIIRKDDVVAYDARLLDVSQLCLFGNVQVTTQAIRTLTRRGIPVIYLSYGGFMEAVSEAPGHKHSELRIAQYEAARDPKRRMAIARAFVGGKIRNCRTLLRRNHKGNSAAALSTLRRLERRAATARTTDSLLGIEGSAARAYFNEFSGMFHPNTSSRWVFSGRNRRPPRDPVNALLSFIYALVVKDAYVAIAGIGLDPYIGFYHTAKYGRPAPALDLAEEFRPLLGDSLVIGLINKRQIRPDQFEPRAGGIGLNDDARRIVLTAYEQRMATPVFHPIFRRTVPYRTVIHLQARLLVRTLMGKSKEYVPFRTR